MRHHISHHKNHYAIGFFSLVIGVALGAYFHKETIIVRENTADTPAAMRAVNLMVDYGNGEVRTWNTVSWHESMSVVDLLTMVGSADNVPVTTDGVDENNLVVTAVNGIATSENERWQYWVNNTYEPAPASKYNLKPGDIVMWKFVREQAQ